MKAEGKREREYSNGITWLIRRPREVLLDVENEVTCVCSSVCELTSPPRFDHVSTSSTILCIII